MDLKCYIHLYNMGLGLLFLASVGKENLYLSGNAEITYFKFIYKQYSNFSIESMSQFFKTEADFSRKITVNISKNADLLSNSYLHVKLPSIPLSNHSYLPSGIKKFKWIDKIGFGLIKYIDLEIGGILIDRINGEYLNLLYELDRYQFSDGYNKMIGNVEELTNYSNSKDSYSLDIPIQFWFHKNYKLALPLVALYHSDIKIHVEFNNINKCYMESPTHYITISNSFCLFKENEIIKQEIDGNISIGRFCYFDVTYRRLYFDKIYNDFIIPTSTNNILYNIKGTDTEFEAIVTSTSSLIKDESYFTNNLPSIELSYLILDYIYLDNTERFKYINNEITYVVPVLDIIPEKKIFSINSDYKLDCLNNPTKLLIWRTQLLSNYNSNDLFNYSSYPVDLNSTEILNNIHLVINSINREEISFTKFYNILQVYYNELYAIKNGIYVYSFGLESNRFNQSFLINDSSGYCNFNKISDAYLQLSFNKLISYKNPVLLKGYAISLNLFKVNNGLGQLVFYN